MEQGKIILSTGQASYLRDQTCPVRTQRIIDRDAREAESPDRIIQRPSLGTDDVLLTLHGKRKALEAAHPQGYVVKVARTQCAQNEFGAEAATTLKLTAADSVSIRFQSFVTTGNGILGYGELLRSVSTCEKLRLGRTNMSRVHFELTKKDGVLQSYCLRGETILPCGLRTRPNTHGHLNILFDVSTGRMAWYV